MDLKDTVLRALNELVKNGGEGSGDFNHAGNPPHVGGSEPVESRHARGFKSKSERKEVKKEEKKPTFKPVKGIIQTLKDDYEAGKINAKEVAKELSKANLTPYLLDDSEALEKIGVKQSDSKDKQSDSKEKNEETPLINPEKQKKINDLIRVADDVSMFDSGSIEKRENERAFKELESLNISDEEKEKAKKKLIEYHENILTHLAKSPSQYKVGLAEFDKRVGLKKSQSHYEKATELKAERNGIIKEIKEKLRKEEARKEKKALADVAMEALKSGKMEFEHNGEIWFRTSKRAKSFIGLDKYSQPKYEKMKANNSLYKHEYIEY